MSSSVAPLFPTTSVFIPAFWASARSGILTEEDADARYLRFPVGQGTESIPNLIVSGSSTLGVVSASTLSQSGTYTNTNSGTPAKQVIINNTTPSITITDGTNTTTITPTSVGTANTLQQVLDAGNSATGANAKIALTDNSVGGSSFPSLRLLNSNATAGNFTGVPCVETYKYGRNVVASDVITTLQFNANNYLGTKTLFGKIECLATSSSAGGGDDGALDFYSCVNGTSSLVMRLNGADNENNSFRPLDMNGNAIKTSSGNITIDGTSAPSGSGQIDISPRTTAVCNVNSNLRIPSNSNNLVIGTTANGYAGLMSAQGTNYTGVSASLFSQLSFSGLRLAQGTLYAENKTNIQTYEDITLSNTDGSGFITTAQLNNNVNSPFLQLKRDFGSPEKSITMACETTGAGQNSITAVDSQSNNPFLIDTSGYVNGAIELKVNDTSGSLKLTSASLESNTSTGSAGKYLVINLNGTDYKIALENV